MVILLGIGSRLPGAPLWKIGDAPGIAAPASFLERAASDGAILSDTA
jgi:hypothetical protein